MVFLLLFYTILNTPVQASTKKYIFIRNKITQLALNDSYQFLIKTSGLKTTRLVWKSSAPSIASISASGKVTAKAPGTVTITATDSISNKRSVCTFRVRQKETPISSLKYSINGNEVTINGLKEECSTLVLPERINGLPVTRINSGAFYKNKKLSLIDLPSTLKVIDDQAFRDCTALKTVYFPQKMTKLGDYLFYHCTSLTTLSLPKTCTTVSDQVLTGSNLGFCSPRQASLELDSNIFLSKKDILLLEQMKKLLKKIVLSSDSDVEKVKKVHNWITSNCTYDTAAFHAGSTIDPDSSTAYGVINNHKAICSGYAETFSLFMKLCDIPTVYITGKAGGVSHSWNLVKLSGNWYHVDTTWDDPVPEKNTVFYNHFLLDDKAMKKTHVWDTNKYPACSSTQYLYYVYKGHIVDTLSNSKEILSKLSITSGKWVTVLFPGKVDLQSILSNSNISYKKIRYFSPKSVGKYMSYTFCID